MARARIQSRPKKRSLIADSMDRSRAVAGPCAFGGRGLAKTEGR
jgi:hypothetical protein